MGDDTTTDPDLSQISDAIAIGDSQEDENEEIKTAIEDGTVLVGPILKEFFRHATQGTDYWMKKRSLRILADWIVNLQNVATIMEQQLEALSQVCAAQEAELEELRPTKKKIWTPFPN